MRRKRSKPISTQPFRFLDFFIADIIVVLREESFQVYGLLSLKELPINLKWENVYFDFSTLSFEMKKFICNKYKQFFRMELLLVTLVFQFELKKNKSESMINLQIWITFKRRHQIDEILLSSLLSGQNFHNEIFPKEYHRKKKIFQF